MTVSSLITRHVGIIKAMGQESEAALAVIETAIGGASGANKFGKIDLFAASEPASAFTKQYGEGPTVVMAAGTRPASAGRF